MVVNARKILSGGGPGQANDKIAYYGSNSTVGAIQVSLASDAGVDYIRVANAPFQANKYVEICSANVIRRDLTRYQALGVTRLRVVNALPISASVHTIFSSGPQAIQIVQEQDSTHYIARLFNVGVGTTLLEVGVDYSHLIEVSPSGDILWWIDGVLELSDSGAPVMADEAIRLQIADLMSDDQQVWAQGFFRCEYDDPANATKGRPGTNLAVDAIYPSADVESADYHDSRVAETGHGAATFDHVDDWATGTVVGEVVTAITGEGGDIELWEMTTATHPDIEAIYWRVFGNANVADKTAFLTLIMRDQDGTPNEETVPTGAWLNDTGKTRSVCAPLAPDGNAWNETTDPQDELDKLRAGLTHPNNNGAHILIGALMGEVLSLDNNPSAPTIEKSASDTLGLATAATVAVERPLSAVDTIGLAIAETSDVVASEEAVTKEASDTLGLAITETTLTQANATASDTVALGIGEATVTQANASATETLGLATAEGTPDALVIVAVADTVGLAIAGAVAIEAGLTATDTAGLAVVEGTSAVAVVLSATDTVGLAIVATVAIAAQFGSADAIGLATVEGAPDTLVIVAVADTMGLATVEGASVVAVVLSGSDTLSLAITSTSAVAVSLSSSDTVGLAITETTTLQVNASATETLGLATPEGTPTIFVTLAGSDTVGLAITETVAVTVILPVAADTVGLAITEGASTVAVTVAGSDTLSLTLAESVPTVLVTLSGTETLGLAITSQKQLEVRLSGSDAVALAATESVATEARFVATDAVSLGILEAVAIEAGLTASDAVTLDTVDASTAPVVTDILGEIDLPDILDDIRDCLLEIDGIRDVDSFWPTNLGALPRIILRYLDSPWDLSLQRAQIHHEIEVEIVIAPESDARRAQRKAAGFVNDVKAKLLPDACVGFTIVTVGSEGMRRVSYHGRRYWAAIVKLRAVETAGATL